MVKEIGFQSASDILTILIVDVVKFFSVGKGMNKEQVIATTELILEEFTEICIADLKLCFNKAKLGEYGTLYDRMDGGVILNWITQYCDNKMSHFINKNAKIQHLTKDFENNKRSEQMEVIGKRITDIKRANERHNIQKLIDNAKPQEDK